MVDAFMPGEVFLQGEDGRTAPGVCSHGSILLSHSGEHGYESWITHIHSYRKEFAVYIQQQEGRKIFQSQTDLPPRYTGGMSVQTIYWFEYIYY